MFLILCCLMVCSSVHAVLNVELTKGAVGQVMLYAEAHGLVGIEGHQQLLSVFKKDLGLTGRVEVVSRQQSADYTVRLSQSPTKSDHVCMVIAARGEAQNIQAPLCLDKSKGLRLIGHHFAHVVYKDLIGHESVFLHQLIFVRERSLPGSKQRRYSIELADFDGVGGQVLVASHEPLFSPALSPNGQKLAYVSYEHHKASIRVYDFKNKTSHTVASFPGVNGTPVWTKDHKYLIISLSLAGEVQLYKLRLSDGQLVKLTKNAWIETNPLIDADGQSLLFVSNKEAGVQIYRRDLKTDHTKRLTFKGNYNVAPSISTDGKKMAFVSRVDGRLQLVILDRDTQELRVVGSRQLDDMPALTQDGLFVVFSAGIGGHRQLMMRSLQNNQLIALQTGDGQIKYPLWRVTGGH